jgi:hypothetical protein
VDHPVLLSRAEQRIAAAQPLSREDDDDLLRLPLLAGVGAAIPDTDLAGAVAPGRDRALEVDVVERVVLDMDSLAVVLRVLRQPVRYRPRGERSIMLETQVPVQAPCVVLVHDEARHRRDG